MCAGWELLYSAVPEFASGIREDLSVVSFAGKKMEAWTGIEPV